MPFRPATFTGCTLTANGAVIAHGVTVTLTPSPDGGLDGVGVVQMAVRGYRQGLALDITTPDGPFQAATVADPPELVNGAYDHKFKVVVESMADRVLAACS